MDVLGKRVEELGREVGGLQSEVGAMKGQVEGKLKEVEDEGKRQTAAMNVVVEQARGEFGMVKQGLQNIVAESTRAFEGVMVEVTKLKGDCEMFGTEVRGESAGIKSVVTNMSTSHGEAIGKVMQRVSEIEKRLGMEHGGRTGGETTVRT